MQEGVEDVTVRAVRRRAHVFSLPSGLLLFICVFLPMRYDACDDKVVYAYDATVTLIPHALGLVAAIAAAARALGPMCSVRRARRMAVVELVIWAIVFHLFLFELTSKESLIGASLSAAAAFWLLIGATVWLSDLGEADGAGLPTARLGRSSAASGRMLNVAAAVMLATVAAATQARPRRPGPRPTPSSPAPSGDSGHGFWGC